MLPVLSYHLNNNLSNFECILDDDESKDGLFYINLPVPIRKPTNIDNLRNANIMIMAVNNTRQILPKLLSYNPKRIILPFHNI